MGKSVKSAATDGLIFKKENPSDIIVALAGNPNVGKSTVFNGLTGLKQHTGNWAGKTVDTKAGSYIHNGRKIILVDIPGTYSLFSHSCEEDIARDFICFGGADVNVVVCDATCLERNLNLLLQITEISDNTVLCVNLIDEAEGRGIHVDIDMLSSILHIPVVATTAREGKGLNNLSDEIIKCADLSVKPTPFMPQYPRDTEKALTEILTEPITALCREIGINPRLMALRILERDISFFNSLKKYRGVDFLSIPEIADTLKNTGENNAGEMAVTVVMNKCEKICNRVIRREKKNTAGRDLKIDKIITSKKFGIPLMILLLGVVFWITISGANYPSSLLSSLFSSLEDDLYGLLISIGLPTVICELAVHGIYRVVTWIISVMLPPMAIFFPLFTLLEDSGYLPRVAFNLDRCFKKCNACGKQSLTMCMGFGCNAAGVVGCRIIDSRRERLIAILTNSLVPCNGRFPTIITLISIFFVGTSTGFFSNLGATALLCLFLLLSIGMTFSASFILSKTVLKGVPSSFTLELPPYRRPQILKVIVRSVFDRTLFVLGRALVAAVPAGLIIWLAANVHIGGASLLSLAADFLNPLGLFLGLDGVILIAFILGLPANEIVIPIIIMAYMGLGTLTDIGDLAFLKTLFTNNGWTPLTALNVILFSLFHWPCATTLLTIKKETGSLKWTVLAAVLPTVIGMVLCAITNFIFNLF